MSNKTMTTPHEGHRERMRERIRKEGIGHLEPHEVLEYFLFPFVPRRNTNDIAHELISRFGSLSGVLDADYNALAEVPGMTCNAALFLSQIPALLVQYKTGLAKTQLNFLQPEHAALYLNELIGNRPVENCAALAVDVKGNLLGTIQFESSRTDAVSLDVRKLVKELLLIRAAGVVVAHNHPSGDVLPSQEDYQTYQMLNNALEPLGIVLLDCMIVGKGNAFSLCGNQAKAQANGLRFAETYKGDAYMGREIDAGVPEEDEYNLLFNRNDNY